MRRKIRKRRKRRRGKSRRQKSAQVEMSSTRAQSGDDSGYKIIKNKSTSDDFSLPTSRRRSRSRRRSSRVPRNQLHFELVNYAYEVLALKINFLLSVVYYILAEVIY